jgi:hypothetical protein
MTEMHILTDPIIISSGSMESDDNDSSKEDNGRHTG